MFRHPVRHDPGATTEIENIHVVEVGEEIANSGFFQGFRERYSVGSRSVVRREKHRIVVNFSGTVCWLQFAIAPHIRVTGTHVVIPVEAGSLSFSTRGGF